MTSHASSDQHSLRKVHRSGGVDIEFEVYLNHKARPTLLLLLPFGSSKQSSEAFVAMFTTKFNVIVWNGRHINDDNSSVDMLALTVKSHTEDINALVSDTVNHLDAIVGYCSGAAMALVFAARFPEKTSRLFLVCGEYVLTEKGFVTARFKEVDSLLRMASRDLKASKMIVRKLDESEATKSVVKEASYFNKVYLHPNFLYRYSINYVDFAKENYDQHAAKITIPAHVYCSIDDTHVSAEASEFISGKLSNASFHKGAYGDHYNFCRKDSVMLNTLKADCVNTLQKTCAATNAS